MVLVLVVKKGIIVLANVAQGTTAIVRICQGLMLETQRKTSAVSTIQFLTLLGGLSQ